MIPAHTIAAIASQCHSGRGAPPKVPSPEVIASTVFHELQPHGTQAEHLFQLTGRSVTDGALSLRRQPLDPRVFRQVLEAALRPLADPTHHPESFYRGLRLLGIDGTRFSVPNSEAHAARWEKAHSRRGQAAFAQIDLVVLSELGLHNPIAAAIGEQQQAEMTLARELLDRVPPDSLTLGDRYYGVGKCIAATIPLWQQRGSHFLFRVRSNLKRRVLQRRRDGSARVEIRPPDGTRLEVREIRATVRARGGKRIVVRLWTSLLDAKAFPARELLALYAQRWEMELATDELKNKLHRGHRLKSLTPATAVQEMAALVLAQAVVTRVRMRVAAHAGVPTLRASFGKSLGEVQALWRAVEWGAGVLSAKQVKALVEGCLESLVRQLTPRRRARSCPRAVRQPVSSWPRLMKTKSVTGPIEYEVIKIKK
jgi:hypothetical protein